MSPRPGPRRRPITFRATAEQRHQLDLIAADEGLDLSAVLSRAVDAEIKRVQRRKAKT